MINQKGFTIVEMLVVIFLVAVCSIVIVDLFIGQNRVYKVETAELNIASDARSAVDDINNYVRQASRTLSSYDTYTAGSNVLILQLKGLSASNQLLPAATDIVVYYLDGANLYRQIFPDASSSRLAELKRLASTVNSISFTYNNGDYALVTEVTTDITAQEDAGVQNRAITVTSKSTLRNY